ncbi:MAG: hypothetical protein FWG88_01895 [Oscillospiraceae bacterium]|nr:hypothetical protein [Oscillospiraceae bacterium]
MPNDMKRFMLYITPDIEAGADELKRKLFYNKPYSELYRCLLSLGLETANNGSYEKKKKSNNKAADTLAK